MAWYTRKPKPLHYSNEIRQVEGYFNAITRTLSRVFGGTVRGFGNGLKDFFTVFGWNDVIAYQEYAFMYRRGGIANTVVAKVAKACWRNVPEVQENDKAVLEKELIALEKAGLFKGLEKADILNRIGSFSVMLIGVPDGEDLDKELGTVSKSSPIDKDSLYFKAYSEDGTTISKWETDITSPRYGMPLIYELRVLSQDDPSTQSIGVETRRVHWTRVVHMAEGALDDDFAGISALEAPWNALLDKEKTRGASAEAFFGNARQKYALEADKDAQLPQGDDKTEFESAVADFNNGMKNFLKVQGIKTKVFQPNIASPKDTFNICIEEVSGVTGIPIRVLTGVGGGQLAGSEDRAAWNSLVNDRQESVCSTFLQNALEILSDSGMIDLPENSEIVWPLQTALNESEEAENIQKRSTAVKNIADAVSSLGGDGLDLIKTLEKIGLEGLETVTTTDD